MSFLEIVFDPASFAGGSAVTAVAFSIGRIRNKMQANGAVAKSAELSSKFRPVYAELENRLAAADERISVFSFDYQAAYPSGQKNPAATNGIQRARDRVREYLNLMLTKLNALDNSHLSSKTITEYWTLLDNNSRLATSSLHDVDNLLARYEEKLHTSIVKIKSLKRDAQVLGDNLKKAQSDYADALTRFDRLFLESVPPALFKAEKTYGIFVDAVNETIDNVEKGRGYATRDVCGTARSASMKAMTTLENHLDKVLVYSDVAKSEATKHRAEMRRAKYNSGEKYTTAWDAALESLMDAESRPYDKGNPKIEFEETIKPYRTFIYNNMKGVYSKR